MTTTHLDPHRPRLASIADPFDDLLSTLAPDRRRPATPGPLAAHSSPAPDRTVLMTEKGRREGERLATARVRPRSLSLRARHECR